MIRFLLVVVITAAVVGVLRAGATTAPRSTPLWMTVLGAAGGALLGGLVAVLAGAGDLLQLVLEIVGAVAVVYLLQHRRAAS